MISTTALKRRAPQGDVDAQFRLGYRLAFARARAKRSAKEAVRWWRRAAGQGHTRAQFYLGVAYDRGCGVPKNLKRAMCFYWKAAEAGHPEAQYNLALGYRKGEGVPTDHK